MRNLTNIDIKNRTFYFPDTAFDKLMTKRINKILILCSTYDYFILEEDGRIEEQIFMEYVSLNLRYPPKFIHASSAHEAFTVLEEEGIDLIITMFSVEEMDAFALSKKIKLEYPTIPIVLLNAFSREVSIRLSKADLSSIDYVFSWLGNADLLLAIIKLIEDSMNAEYDVNEVGVQAILLVEDSVRYYSSYLPAIYKLIFKQSKGFMTEGLNEHQQMLRMRGRPKILLATSYEAATALYDEYKNNLLGIISDISYQREGKKDPQAGIHLVRTIKAADPYLPILLQSSDNENRNLAKELQVGFIHKYSKTLSIELRDFINEYFAFGNFKFIDPSSRQVLHEVANLKELQDIIYNIPDASLEYHIYRNHFSKWLTARALFPVAEIFKSLRPEDFENLDQTRCFLFDTISNYRKNKGRGIISKFYQDKYDEYQIFSRIGEGSLGGKARGLAFVDSLIKRNFLMDKYPGVVVTIPRTVVISTEIFDEFMEINQLYDKALSSLSDDEILGHFLQGNFPDRISEDLNSFIRLANHPIAVRSSSLLEDSHYQPYAGVYATYMIPLVKGGQCDMHKLLCNAIKAVYASVFFKNSKAYMIATSNVIDEEKMAIVLQEVSGKAYGERFYPTISGVARSVNFYPIEPEKPEEGIVNMAFGLGKYVVEGEPNLRFSPKYPKKILQLSSPAMTLRETQKSFYALNLNCVPGERLSTDDTFNFLKLSVKDAESDSSLKHAASTYDFENNIIRDGINYPGKKLITFANVLKYNTFPIAEIISDLLQIGQHEMNNPVEIEFAVNLDTAPHEPRIFHVLQIRPIVDNREKIEEDLSLVNEKDTIIYSQAALGNGIIDDINEMIFVKPENWDPSKTRDIAEDIARLNDQFVKSGKTYILQGPGRWGSSDPWLGIPVKWSQISNARVIIESGLENYRVDPSQGTHFFQNLTSFRIGYFTVNPFMNDGHVDFEHLNNQHVVFENQYLKHISFKDKIQVKIDGQQKIGLVLKVPKPLNPDDSPSDTHDTW